MESVMLPPWIASSVQEQIAAYRQDRLHHALLFNSIDPIENRLFAQSVAAHLLCQNLSACGQCKPCLLLQANTHPDCYLLEADGQQIKVDQIRALIGDFANTANQGGIKVAIIEQAHLLNEAAQNALLKTLEEPSPDTFILLLSHQVTQLATTITSRIKPVHQHRAQGEMLKQWAQSQGIAAKDLWIAKCVGGVVSLAHQPDTIARYNELRSLWVEGLKSGNCSAELAKACQEFPHDGLICLQWLLNLKLTKVSTTNVSAVKPISQLISECGQIRQKLQKMSTVSYFTLCQHLLSCYRQIN